VPARLLSRAAGLRDADVVLVDVGPNLGAIHRSALIAAPAFAPKPACSVATNGGRRRPHRFRPTGGQVHEMGVATSGAA
jgi:hypothetical protein